MANVNMFVPPDLQEEQASIERSRRYAELLRSQAQPQEGKMVSGHYVAPGALSYVNQILGGVLAGKQSREADTRAAALGKQLAGRQSEWANAMPKATPDREVPLAEGAVMTRTEPGTNPSSNDFLQWAMKGMEVNPQMAQAGFNMADRIEGREAQAGAQKAAQEQRIEELRIRSEDARLSQQERLAAAAQARQEQQAFRTQMMQDQQANAREMARINASNRVAPAPSLVQIADEKGEPVYVDSRQAIGKTPYQKAAPGTPNKAAEARDALTLISDAEKLVDVATGSGLGNAADMAAGFLGATTKSGQAAAQLKALEGALVAKMPKMSGPQSDKDVAMYKQMAADIGNPNTPSANKRAALQTVKEIQMRYAGEAPAAAPAAPGASGRNIVVDW